MPAMQEMQKWAAISTQEFARRLKILICRGFCGIFRIAHGYVHHGSGLQHAKSAGYVIGGAMGLVKPSKNATGSWAGNPFQIQSRKILVDDDKAVGIKLENGKEYRATTLSPPVTAARRSSICSRQIYQ